MTPSLLRVKLLGLMLVCAPLPTFAWQAVWQTQLGDGGEGDASAVAITPDGHVVVAGAISTSGSGHFSVTMLDGASGAPVWQSLDEPGYVRSLVLVDGKPAAVGNVYEGTIIPSFNQLVGVSVTLEGATGTQTSRVTLPLQESSGNVIWAGDATATTPGGDIAVAVAGQVTNDAAPAPGQQFYVDLRHSVIAWQRFIAPFSLPPYQGPGSARDVQFHPSGDLIAVGETQELAYDQFGRLTVSARHALVARLARTSGAVLWTTLLPETSSLYGLRIDPSGDVVAIGVIDEAGLPPAGDANPKDALVLKLAGADGGELWRRTYGVSGNWRDAFTSLAVDAAGDIVVGGQLHTRVNDPYWDNQLGLGTREALVVKLAGSDGQERWQRPLPNTVDNVMLWPFTGVQGNVHALALDSDGSVVAAGMIDADAFGAGVTANVATFTVARLDGATGNVQWLQQPGPGIARSVAIGHDQSIVVGGRVYVDDPTGDSDRNDLVVIKFSDRLTGAAMQLVEGAAPDRRRLKVASKDRLVHLPRLGSAADPSQAGARMIVTDITTGEQTTYDLPASGWRGKTKTLKYTDSLGIHGPCTRVQLTQGKQIKAQCRGAGVDTRAARGGGSRIAVRLELGPPNSVYYCMEFGGAIIADTPGNFRAAGASAPSTCAGL